MGFTLAGKFLRMRIFQLFFKISAATILAYLFVGNVERERLGILLIAAVVVLAIPLWRDWRKPRPNDQRWKENERHAARITWEIERDDISVEQYNLPDDEALPQPTEAELRAIMSRPEWQAEFMRRHRRRDDADLLLDALCLATVPVTGLAIALMVSSPVVAWSGSDRGPAVFGLAIPFALHLTINLIPASLGAWRIRARLALLAAVYLPALFLAKELHPYLLVGGKEHRRLLGERVYDLALSVEAGRHSDALSAYARDLEEERRWTDAARIYQRAIDLNAFSVDAQEGMARTQTALGNDSAAAAARLAAIRLNQAASVSPTALADNADLVTNEASLPLFDWHPTYNLKICLIPAGEVPAPFLDEAGRRLSAELNVPVFRWNGAPLTLPDPDQRAVLLGDPQWTAVSLMTAFVEQMRREELQGLQARGAWQFLVVTDADLYLPDANYVFAVQFPVHGVVSFARMGESGDKRRIARLSKQLVATAIKCFGVKQAASPDCVTSYVRSLNELDRKPIKATPETWADYRRRVELWESDTSRSPAPPH